MPDVVAAVDIGGTRVKAALVDRSYDVLARVTARTPQDIASDLGPVLRSTVDELMAQAGQGHREPRLVGCGVVVPGLVDEARGVGLLSVNLGWRDLAVRDVAQAHLDVPVAVGHDVRAGLLAEARLGAARGARHALFVPLGTGIAGALLLEGVVISADGWAGELGHVVVDPFGPTCPCGATGCLEVISSAAAVERSYATHAASAAAHPGGGHLGAKDIAARAAAGEPAASAVWSRAVSALGQAIAATVTITGVDLVLVGGGLAESGPILLDPLRADVLARLTFQRPPSIERAALGDRAGCLGAACLAWDAL